MNAGRGSTVQIVDDLTDMEISRQRKYQIRKMRQGLCIICGRRAYKETLFCLKHNHKRGIKDPGRNKNHFSKWD